MRNEYRISPSYTMSQENNQTMLAAYEAYADAIYRHCYFRVYNADLARDIMQETFCKTWAYMAEGKEVKNMKAFLYRVANNLIIDEARKKKESSLDELTEKGIVPNSIVTEDDTEKRILTKEVLLLVNKLDESYQTVIIMRFIDELSPKEIAGILDTSENSVSVKIHRGIEKLRDLGKNNNLIE